MRLERKTLVCLLGLFSATSGIAQSPPPTDPVFTVIHTDGSRIEGRLTRLDELGLGLAPDPDRGAPDEPGSLEWTWTDLVSLRRRTAEPTTWPPSGSLVVFPDGDCLRAIIGPASEESLSLLPQSLGDSATTVPLDSLLGVVFSPPPDPEGTLALLDQIRSEPRPSEVLWLGNGDRLTGSLLSIGGSAIGFNSEAGDAEVPRSSVTAIGFAPELVHYPRPDTVYLELFFHDGSRLGLSGATLDRGAITGVSRFGTPVRAPIASIDRIDVRGDHLVYLADVEEAAVQYQGYIGDHPSRYGRNTTWDGHVLRQNRQPYHRGLGMLPRTLIAYRLDPRDTRFQAEIALDDRAGLRSNVVFRVLLDGKEHYASPEFLPGHPPEFVDIDLTGAKLLILAVEFGAGGNIQDSADWLDARLLRRPE